MDDDTGTGDTGNPTSTPFVTGLVALGSGGLGMYVGLPWYAALGLMGGCLGAYWLHRDGR